MEITLRSRGPVIRAEASASDPYAALDLAAEKLDARLRKQHDKRFSRRGARRIPAAEVPDHVPGVATLNGSGASTAQEQEQAVPTKKIGSLEVQGDGPLVVREKTHVAAPMTLDQALYEMELVGHDFYLFVDSETKEPSVVYRRHAYDYGVIHLRTDTMVTENHSPRRAEPSAADPPGDSTAGAPGARVRPRGTGVPPPGGRTGTPVTVRHGIMAAAAQQVGRCLGLAMVRTTGHSLQGRNAMADSFGPMRDEDADDGVVGMGPDADTPRKEPIRVLVVDDHALFRRGLEIVLAAEEDIQVVGEAGDGAEAVEKAADLLPDIVLMDVRMPKRGGIEACTSIKEVAPSAKIIMLTISDEEADLYDAIKAGATGYLLKEISTDEVATAIRAVADGQSQISPSMASKLLTEFKSMIQRTDERRLVPAPRLTDRELEVLKLVATGMNNRDIAKELFISENTVKNHVRNILEKLQLHSRMEAVVYAMREKILEIR